MASTDPTSAADAPEHEIYLVFNTDRNDGTVGIVQSCMAPDPKAAADYAVREGAKDGFLWVVAKRDVHEFDVRPQATQRGAETDG